MAFKMKGFPKHAGVGGSPMNNNNGDSKKEKSEPGTLEKLGSKLDPYYQKVKETDGKGVEAHRKGVEKAKEILTGDIARTGAALGMGPLGVAGQVTKEIYEKVTGKGKEGSSISTSGKKAQKKTEKSKSKGKKLEMGISPVGVTRPKKELKKMEGKKATTISTPKTEKSMVKKENLMNKQIKLDQAKNRKKRRKR